MSTERASVFDISSEVDRYFDDSSLPRNEQPHLNLLMGGCASGKTTIRKERFATGYVLVDAAEIFLSLSRGKFFPFPDTFEEPMNMIGRLVAQRAVSERRHIVTELIPLDIKATNSLVDVMQSIGYRFTVHTITCDPEVAWQRNVDRPDDNISCCYAEPYHLGWLLDAATASLNPDYPSVEGPLRLTRRWCVELPGKFNQRSEEGKTILWRPGIVFQVSTWQNTANRSIGERVAQLMDAVSSQALDLKEVSDSEATKLSFRSREGAEGTQAPALSCYLIDSDGQVEVVFNFDDEADLAIATSVWLSLREDSQP